MLFYPHFQNILKNIQLGTQHISVPWVQLCITQVQPGYTDVLPRMALTNVPFQPYRSPQQNKNVILDIFNAGAKNGSVLSGAKMGKRLRMVKCKG
jgi:hypothetical protein